jgi:hypothetical protein
MSQAGRQLCLVESGRRHRCGTFVRFETARGEFHRVSGLASGPVVSRQGADSRWGFNPCEGKDQMPYFLKKKSTAYDVIRVPMSRAGTRIELETSQHTTSRVATRAPSPRSKEAVGRNLYLYLRVKIHTCIRTCRVCHSTYKNHIKIISLMIKSQYTHVQN